MIAALAGASGLVGRHCLKHLLATPDYQSIFAVGRSPLKTVDARVKQIVTPLDLIGQIQPPTPIDVGFCCLGTTIRKAGSKTKFLRVDYEYVLKFARWTKANGATSFTVVSSVGADPNSKFFYMRSKGEMEAKLKDLAFDTLNIFRPSLLLGERDEFRLGEKLGELLSNVISPLLPASSKAIKAETVAAAMVNASLLHSPGLRIFTHDQIVAEARHRP